jgi:nitroreductase
MDFANIVKERKSMRAFKPDNVAKEEIEEVLGVALRAPSAINLQPWEVTVVMDEERQRLSRRLLKAYKEKRIPCSPGNVKPMPALYTTRGVQSFNAMKPYLDELGSDFNQFINEGSCDFYGAPVAVIIAIDNSFSKARFVDIGIFLGYLLLAAHDAGLWTCPIGLIAAYEDEVREALNIPESKHVVVGVALGHPDSQSPANRFTSPREDLSKIVRWID